MENNGLAIQTIDLTGFQQKPLEEEDLAVKNLPLNTYTKSTKETITDGHQQILTWTSVDTQAVNLLFTDTHMLIL